MYIMIVSPPDSQTNQHAVLLPFCQQLVREEPLLLSIIEVLLCR